MLKSEVVVSLTSFVTELALAWQRLAMYQPGHPERKQALDRAHAVLAGLVAPTGSLALGVGRQALIGPDEKLTSAPAARLAAALYVLEVAVLRFEEGVEAAELEHFLNLLPRGETLSEGRDLGLELQQNDIRHIRIEAVDFSGLVATDNLEGDGVESLGDTSLWDRILQRLLNDQRFIVDPERCDDGGGSPLGRVQAVLGQVLENYGISGDDLGSLKQGSSAMDVVETLSGVVGEAAGEEMLEAEDEGSRRSTARHVTELIGAMPEGMQHGILDAAVRELVVRDEAAPGLSSLGSAVSAAQMVGSLRRLRSDKVGFSPRVVSAVESLVAEGVKEIDHPNLQRDPDELAQQLRAVFSDEDVDRAPLAGGLDDRIFLELRRHVPVHAMFTDLSPYLESITDERLDVDLSMTLVDLLQRPFLDESQIGWVIERQQEVFKVMLGGGRFVAATRIVEYLRDQASAKEQIKPVREAAERCLAGLREPQVLSGIVDALGEVKSLEIGLVHNLIGLLGPTAIHQLLCVLGEESELSRRRHIFDLLVSLGPAVVPASIGLLGDHRWYMIRNILSLLRHVGEGLTLEVLQNALMHEDSRVRVEAIKCVSDLGSDIPPSLVERVLADEDLKVAEMAIGIFGSARIDAAKQPLVELLKKPDRLGRQRKLRLRALQTLGELGDAGVLNQIAPYFRSWFAPVSVEERHAAYRSLRLYSEADRRSWLKKGRFSLDPVIREICRSLGAESPKSGVEG